MIDSFIQPESMAILFARLLLGILFVFQGYDKIFKLKIIKVIQTIEPSYKKLRVPGFFIGFFAYFTSFAEFAGGMFLILGIFKYFSLYLLGIDLIIVSLGMSLIDPVWKMDIVFPRFILLIFVLIFPSHFDILTLEHLLTGN